MLLEIKQGTVSRGGRTVLDLFNFYIKGTEKVAIVGRNGAGKTTLLQILAGQRELDADEKHPGSGLFKAREMSTAMLSQRAVQDPSATVEAYIEDCMKRMNQAGLENGTGRRTYEVQFDRMFTELGFSLDDKEKKLGDFSGGEQTKIVLIGLLLAQPDVLLLDEPTNHLDIDTVEWLEKYLKKYPKAVVAVSHDRFFIDQMAEVVWEISDGKLYRYVGNYTDYRKQKAAVYEKQKRAWTAQQEEIRRLEDLIERFKHKPRKAAFARSRKKILDRMEKIPRPNPEDAEIHPGDLIPAQPGSRLVFSCEHLQIGYDQAIKELSFRMRRGQKIGVFGPNGTGKSAFLKTIAGKISPLKGKLQIGEHIEIGYFDQMSANLDADKNVFDWFHDQFPVLEGEKVRKILAGYLFREGDLGKKVSSLSGGEKARLVLAAMLQRRPNFLILDEPTNNMDIPAREAIESIFQAYKGTILFVSHDRYFLSRTAEALLLFEPDTRQVNYYPFGYAQYLRKKEEGAGQADVRAAENQKLIDDLRAVPKAERFRLREMSTEEAYADWQFSLNRPEKERNEAAFAKACEKYEESVERWYLYLLSDVSITNAGDSDGSITNAGEGSGIKETDPHQNKETGLPEQETILQQEKEEALQNKEAARDRWTASLLEWYDIWMENNEKKDEEPDMTKTE